LKNFYSMWHTELDFNNFANTLFIHPVNSSLRDKPNKQVVTKKHLWSGHWHLFESKTTGREGDRSLFLVRTIMVRTSNLKVVLYIFFNSFSTFKSGCTFFSTHKEKNIKTLNRQIIIILLIKASLLSITNNLIFANYLI
jgi:hypothetical protein